MAEGKKVRAFDIQKKQRSVESVMDYKRKEFTEAEIRKAQAVVAANAECSEPAECVVDALELLQCLGLMPGQHDWFHKGPDPLTPRPKD